jgi:hypothetical protein
MVLLAERDWFDAAATTGAPASSRFFGPANMALKEQKKAINAEVRPRTLCKVRHSACVHMK